MGNQPVTIYASTVLVMWIILGLIVLLIFAVALVQWYYHKELNIIYAQQDVVGNELSNAWRKLHKHIMVQEETLYKKDNCLKCGAYVIIYDDCVGLLPDEEIDGQLATHSSLVCKLRQEINELKSSSKVF